MQNQSRCRWALWGLLLLASPAAQAGPPPPGGWTAEEIAECARHVVDGHVLQPSSRAVPGHRGLGCSAHYTLTPEQVRKHQELGRLREEERIRKGRPLDESDRLGYGRKK